MRENAKQKLAIGCAIFCALITIVYVATIHHFGRAYRVPNESMAPTIQPGDHVWVMRADHAKRGDVIAFKYPLDPRVEFIKRVVAIGGDFVEIHEKKLYVNGKALAEPYVIHDDPQVYPRDDRLPEPFRSRDQFGFHVVPPDSYFVLGDNRDRSSDSRYFGAVPRANLEGVVVYIYSLKRGITRLASGS